jgi:tetratricopeptide (TPR) repeat protein
VRLLQGALARDPNAIAAMIELAWLRATSADASLRDTSEALAWSERALASSPQPAANTIDTRAAALASAGRFEEAAAIAQRAVLLAGESHDDSLARAAARRLDGYRRGRGYVEPRAPGH